MRQGFDLVRAATRIGMALLALAEVGCMLLVGYLMVDRTANGWSWNAVAVVVAALGMGISFEQVTMLARKRRANATARRAPFGRFAPPAPSSAQVPAGWVRGFNGDHEDERDA